jgi:hypothetical protein
LTQYREAEEEGGNAGHSVPRIILPVPPEIQMLARAGRFTKFSMDVTDQTQKESATVPCNQSLVLADVYEKYFLAMFATECRIRPSLAGHTRDRVRILGVRAPAQPRPRGDGIMTDNRIG